MLRLFVVENTQLNDDKLFEKWLALVDEGRRQRVSALATRGQKNRSLAAGALLVLALRACGYGGEYRLAYGKHGKPRFTQPQGLFFNLSHSGDYTAIVLSDGEVGCDVQRIGGVDLRVAGRYFSEEEKREIAAAGESANSLFHRMWAAKESYLKALGVGLSRPLNSFTVSFGGGGIAVRDGQARDGQACDGQARDGQACNRQADGWRITESCVADGYCMAVCSRQDAPAPEAERLELY